MKRLLSVAVLFLASVSFAAQPWKEPEDFRGLKWGSSPAEAQEFFPTVRFAFALIEVGPVELFTGKNQQVSDNLVVGFDLWFNNKKFSYAEMNFRSDDFEIVRDIFVTRYGKPHRTSTNTLTNAMGARFQNVSLAWDGPTVSIILDRYESATHGRAQIGKRSLSPSMRKQRKSKHATPQRVSDNERSI